MFSLDLDCTQENTPESMDMLIAALWEQGVAGVVEIGPTTVRAFFEDSSQAGKMAEMFGGVPAEAPELDWTAQSRENIEPMNVGDKFFLVPAWRADSTPGGRFRIEINNGLAFGTGRHETTRLCLQLLEKYVRPGSLVIDIGTGSGILAQGARLLGAQPVIACDIDPLAVEVAAASGLQVFIGSAPAIAGGLADVVVANISPECLVEMSDEWLRLLKPGGVAIISGVEAQDQLPFAFIEARAEAEWRAYVLQKPSHT